MVVVTTKLSSILRLISIKIISWTRVQLSFWSDVQQDFHALSTYLSHDRWGSTLVDTLGLRILDTKVNKYDKDNPLF